MFVNLSAGYKLSKRIELWIKMQNITNENYYQYTYITEASTITRRVALRGAEYLGGVSVDF